MMRWFSNVLLVEGELTPASAKAAIAGGRGYVAFEILGTPAGFDLRAEAGGAVTELGGTATAGATVIAEAPQVLDLDPAVEAPLVRMRRGHATAAGSEVVGDGLHIEVPGAAAGAYRAEVRIRRDTAAVSRLGRGQLDASGLGESNPIYVE